MNTLFQRVVTLLFVGVVTASATPLTGCKKDQSATGETAQDAMGLYAKGFNELIAKPQEMVKEYFDKIPEEGPDETKNNKLFPRHAMASSKIDDAAKAFADAKKAAPASLAKLAPLADAAIVAIKKVKTTFEAAQKYYAAENWKDDKFAKGKELHGQMLAVSKEFRTAIDALSTELSTIEDAQAESELKKFGPSSGRYWFRFGNMRAKKLLAVAQKDLSPTYVTELEAALAEFVPVKDGVVAFVTTNGAGLGSVKSVYESYQRNIEDFFATITKIKRAASDLATGDGKNTEEGLMRSFESEVERSTSDYNSLISSGNSMYDLEASGTLN